MNHEHHDEQVYAQREHELSQDLAAICVIGLVLIVTVVGFVVAAIWGCA